MFPGGPRDDATPAAVRGDRARPPGRDRRRERRDPHATPSSTSGPAALTHALRGAGLHTGDHIAIVMDNRLEYFEVLWGAMNAGLYVTPVNWHLAADEVSYIVDDCGAQALVVAADVTDAVAELGEEARALRLALGGELAGFDDFERRPRRAARGTDRRRGRRQLDVLLVRHHRPAEGHQTADHRRAARLDERRSAGWSAASSA